MGVLGWSPDEFWAASMPELTNALAGWREANGGGEAHYPAGTREKLKEALARYGGPSRSIRTRASP